MNFAPDAPIELPSQDRLGRTHFARALAKAIRNWRENDSLVIGLFGGWGSGKSSIKNLALHYLSHRTKITPLVVHFNPWLVSRQEQLVEAFLRDITVALSRPIPGQSAKKAADRLSKLAAYCSAFGSATEGTLNLLAIAGVPGAALGAIAAKGIKNVSATAKQASEAQKELAKAATKTLEELKIELRNSLRDREDPILVVVDDVDRLTSDEICLMFRLIKANADFPKFVYLILCDRPFVTGALERLAPKRGSEFLEKIVQVGFDIPEPRWDDLARLAWTEWTILKRGSADAVRRSDVKRWNELLNLARPYLQHIRAVRRWMNAVRFSFGFFAKRSGFDANPEDFLALELLRIHEPLLYEQLGRTKGELTRGHSAWWPLGPDRDKRKAALKEALFFTVPEERRVNAEALVHWLFPNATWSNLQMDDSELLRDLRVGDERCFDRYFQFLLSKETLTRSEIQKAIADTSTPEAFVLFVRKEVARGRLSILFDHLLAHGNDVIPNVGSLMDSLFEVGDELPDHKWRFGGEGLQAEATSFLLALLRILPDINARCLVLEKAIAKAKGIMVPIFTALYALNDANRKHDQESRWLTPDDRLPALKVVTAAKLREFKESPLLRQASQVGAVLLAWKLCGTISDARSWLNVQLQSHSGSLQALRSAAGIESSAGSWRYTSISVDWLTEFAGIAEIDAGVSRINWVQCDADDRPLEGLYEEGRRQWQAKQDATSGTKASDT